MHSLMFSDAAVAVFFIFCYAVSYVLLVTTNSSI